MALVDASKPRALLSWSSGKDAACALHRVRQQGEYGVADLGSGD